MRTLGTRTRDRGGGPIEMAIMLPLLLLSVFLTAHLCVVYLANQAAQSAAQLAVAGERAWGAEPGAGEDRADNFLAQLGGFLDNPQVTVAVSDDGEQVTATVTGNATAIVPWYAQSVSRTATGPVERVTEVP